MIKIKNFKQSVFGHLEIGVWNLFGICNLLFVDWIRFMIRPEAILSKPQAFSLG